MPEIIFKADQGAGVRKIIRIMQGDSRAHVIRFVVPRYASGVDLSPLTWYIKIMDAKNTPDIALPSGLYEVTAEDVRARWTVNGTYTENVGSVKFQLYGCGKDAEGHVISWTSGAGEIEVTENIGYEVSEEQEEQLDSLDQLIVFVQGELNNVIQAGNNAAAAAATANTAAGNANTATGNANAAIVRVDAAAAAARTATSEANTATTRANASAESAVKAANDANNVMDVKANALSATAAGNPVQFSPDEHSIIKPVLTLLPVQSGSGDPSPDNIRPIAGRLGAELVRCGKNLFNYDEWTNIGVYNGTAVWENNGVVLSAVNDDCFTNYGANDMKAIAVNPGDTMTLSWEHSGASGVVYVFYNDDPNPLAGCPATNKRLTFAVPENGYFLRFRVGVTAAGSTATYKNIQLELGSTASAFEPYQGDTYAINFGQTIYGGKFDWLTGKLVVEWAMRILDGTEGFYAADGLAPYKNFSFEFAEKMPSVHGLVCSHYPYLADHETWQGNTGISEFAGEADKTVRIFDANYPTGDVDAFCAYLAAQYAAGTPVQIAYKLANPITIQLTPQQLTALAGVNTVYGDADEITVHYNKSLNAAFEELKNAILAMGGNV